ncbi:hypothetical protein [uncultured Winogradskyella sp.]|uniref:hypothetical protein n=1 Tax=uncultured Winogradskyella sp. TaxID=395353 RepID=UPI0026242923|nr:hypothetical protein [uncultured Winogradskyella sp.]
MANLIYPVLRRAEFSQPEENLNKKVARQIATEIKNSWKSLSQKHIDVVKKILDSDLVEIDYKQNKEKDARLTEEGLSAFVVDNPVINAQWKNYSFQIRTTIAVCHQESSTKNWTRVSLNNPISKENKDFKKLKEFYKKIASDCCTISHKEFSEIVSKKQQSRPDAIGDFTILTFGVEDEKLGQYLELFDDTDLMLKDLFQNKEAKNLIGDYYKRLFGKNKSDLLKNLSRENFWMTANSNLVNNEGYFENSNVLYKIMLQNNDSIFAYGLGHENSEEKELAKLSSLKIGKHYAKNI